MLKKFSVKNFKNFKDELVLDFSKVRDYTFDSKYIKNGLINKSLLYGHNNTGKSNLGAAVMDIVRCLTESEGHNNILYNDYINGDYVDDIVEFEYEFKFDTKIVTYSYKKDPNANLLSEKLKENNTLLFSYNYRTNKFENNIEEAKILDLSGRNNETNRSVLYFIYHTNISWKKDSTLKQFMDFVSGMLWFRSLRSNEFIGLITSVESMHDFVIKNDLLKDFEDFLRKCGQDYRLCKLISGSRETIGVKYHNYISRFEHVASTGTQALWLFYYWMNRTKGISFLFLDEFDAFYDTRLSKYILSYVNERDNFQSILTTHNTNLISNEIMRPDCYLRLADGKISSFADSTNKTIREMHNLEKMMLSGEFGE